MKKSIIVLSSLAILAIGCKSKEEAKPEEVSIETAVEQMTQALDSANAVAPVADTMAK